MGELEHILLEVTPREWVREGEREAEQEAPPARPSYSYADLESPGHGFAWLALSAACLGLGIGLQLSWLLLGLVHNGHPERLMIMGVLGLVLIITGLGVKARGRIYRNEGK